MIFFSNKDGVNISKGHVGELDGCGQTQDVHFAQADGDELTRCEHLIGRKVPCRVFTFVGHEAQTILVNWSRA